MSATSLIPACRRLPLALAVFVTFAGQATAQVPDEVRRANELVLFQVELARVRALAAGGAGAQLTWPDEQFEAWVFSQYGNAAGAARRLDAQLTQFIEDTDKLCQLTDDQKNKIYLAGCGDMKRFLDGFETLKERFRALNNDAGRLQELLPDVTPLQSGLQTGLLHDDSLVAKAMRHMLTPEQFKRYDAARRDRRATQHRAAVQRAVAMIEQGAPLHADKRRDLVNVLTRETKPPRKSGPYDVYVILSQVGRLPDEKLRPLLDDVQWRALKRVVDQSRTIEMTLRQQGLIPDVDDSDRDAAPPKG